MGLSFHHRRRVRALPLLAAVTVLTALFSATAAQVALASHGKTPPKGGQPPCPSCPDRTPPVGGNGGAGSGGGSGGGATTGGGNSGAAGVPAAPLISLGSISVVNGIASVTGTVNVEAAVNASVAVGGLATANVQVEVNGNPIGISAKGTFSASTNIAANGGILVQAGEAAAGITYSIAIPASAIPSNGVGADALVQLKSDKVTLLLPPDGFTIVDGLDIDAYVRVLGITGIAKLDLNGTNLLARLKVKLGGSGSSGGSSSSGGAGSGSGSGSGSGRTSGGTSAGGGAASTPKTTAAPVKGSAKTVKLTVSGTNGATQTTTVRIQRISSVVRLGRLFSISAFGARGLRIAKITFDRSSLRTGHLGISVTVQDRRHYLVRDAVVMLQPSAHRTTIRGSLVKMSSMLGRATFSVPVSSGQLGHRLYVRVAAQTPRSQTHVTASTVLLPCSCG